jgi:hypothetical protein
MQALQRRARGEHSAAQGPSTPTEGREHCETRTDQKPREGNSSGKGDTFNLFALPSLRFPPLIFDETIEIVECNDIFMS